MYTRIVTHNDMDGLVSAALCSAIHGIEEIVFTGPNHIQQNGFSVLETDIVCDLPYPGEAGLWFDHHAGNIEELKRIGKTPEEIPGALKPLPSCARVVYEYYKEEYDFPDFYEETVRETDKIDSFDYKSVEDWRSLIPARIVNDSLKRKFPSPAVEEEYLLSLVPRLAEMSLSELAEESDVKAHFAEYCHEEEKMMEVIRQSSSFHALDREKEMAILDLTHFHRRMPLVRNLAQIIHPEIKGVFLVQNLFDRGVKTTNFSISGSLTLKVGASNKDIGEIMRVLNIGDGHPGAGSGQVYCASKVEMEKKKADTVDKVFKIWHSQN